MTKATPDGILVITVAGGTLPTPRKLWVGGFVGTFAEPARRALLLLDSRR